MRTDRRMPAVPPTMTYVTASCPNCQVENDIFRHRARTVTGLMSAPPPPASTRRRPSRAGSRPAGSAERHRGNRLVARHLHALDLRLERQVQPAALLGLVEELLEVGGAGVALACQAALLQLLLRRLVELLADLLGVAVGDRRVEGLDGGAGLLLVAAAAPAARVSSSSEPPQAAAPRARVAAAASAAARS